MKYLTPYFVVNRLSSCLILSYNHPYGFLQDHEFINIKCRNIDYIITTTYKTSRGGKNHVSKSQKAPQKLLATIPGTAVAKGIVGSIFDGSCGGFFPHKKNMDLLRAERSKMDPAQLLEAYFLCWFLEADSEIRLWKYWLLEVDLWIRLWKSCAFRDEFPDPSLKILHDPPLKAKSFFINIFVVFLKAPYSN